MARATRRDPIGKRPTMAPSAPRDQVGQLRFSHNIYINLPDTNDVEVFNAIFKALKDNLLR